MNFNKHSNLEGRHAFLGASKYHWLGYSREKLIDVFNSWKATQRGTVLHDFARRCIELGQKLPRSNKTLNMYVNDAIGFKMTPEVTLCYSDYCFGTCDTICFRDNILRIHDYKSGTTPARMEQLLIYAALFCLEYAINPATIETHLRIYQNDAIDPYDPEPKEIQAVMEKITEFDMILQKIDI